MPRYVIAPMSEILSEITGLAPKDCFYIVERHKNEFTYPIHRHSDFELNFVQGGSGVQRVIGDSIETIGDFDLVLIAGDNLEHVWKQGSCTSPDIREITIQFSSELIDKQLLSKNQFSSIRKMFADARHGVSFPIDAIMKVYHILDTIATQQDGFTQFLNMLMMLNELSRRNYKILASSSFASVSEDNGSHRINLVKEFIDSHYAENITLEEAAGKAGMSPSAFSRFFKLHTNRTFTNYLTEVRLGHAARELIDTSNNISQIGYNCGFNNLSNFNRVFKARRGATPKQFRQLYKKNKVVI